MKCYKITDKSGTVVGFKAVNDDNEIMLITNQGIVIRLLCKDISILGRITTGVKLINMDLKAILPLQVLQRFVRNLQMNPSL